MTFGEYNFCFCLGNVLLKLTNCDWVTYHRIAKLTCPLAYKSKSKFGSEKGKLSGPAKITQESTKEQEN